MADEINTNAQAQAVNNGAAPEIDYGKIEAMINKGAQQKENAILKSYFEQLGMSEDGIKTAVSEYKAKQAAAKQQQHNAAEEMRAENEKLKKQIMTGKISSAVTAAAVELGVDKNALGYIERLVDVSDAVDSNGEVDQTKVKAAVEQLLKDLPALKQQSGFVAVGATKEQEKDQTDELRKLFGLKPKKE